MAVFVFNQLGDLYGHVIAEIYPNGTEAITGAVHQDVLNTIVLSLANIFASVPPVTVNEYEDWSDVTEYSTEVVVRHDGKLWLFVGSSPDTGTEPGTNGLVWQELSAVQLAHFRDRDRYLDLAGPYQVSAQELRAHLDAVAGTSSWLAPVQDVLDEPAGGEPDSYRILIGGSASGAFAGHEYDIATRAGGSWTFETAPEDAVVRQAGTSIVWLNMFGAWWEQFDLSDTFPIPTLAEVLASGAATGSTQIQLDRPLNEVRNQYSHLSPGTLTVDLYGQSGGDILVGAAITISHGVMSGNASWWFTITGSTGTHAIAWAASKWSKGEGVTLPSSITLSERYVMHCTTVNGLVHIQSITKVEAV